MSLPILHIPPPPPTDDVLLRYFHQTEYRWTEHLAEAEELDVGVAFASAELAQHPDANRMLMAWLPEQMPASDAVRSAHADFAARGTRCRSWVLNPSLPRSQTEPLASELVLRGFDPVSSDVLYLRKTHVPAPPDTPLTIIPARASFRHARALAEEASVDLHTPQLADAMMLHLDDPHWDALLALESGVAVGAIGVLAVGEIGRIDGLFVSPSHRARGIGRLLVGRALEICARSLFKHVFAGCPPSAVGAQRIFCSTGFAGIGKFVAYSAPDAPDFP